MRTPDPGLRLHAFPTCVGILLLACSALPTGPWNVDLAENVSEEILARRVHEIVAFGPRMGGTPSGERIAAQRERWFASFGLAVRRSEGEPAWCHEEESFSVRAHVAGEAIDLTRAWPWGFSRSASGRAPLSLAPEADKVCLSERGPRRDATGAKPQAWLVDGSVTPDGSWPLPHSVRRDLGFPVFGLARDEGIELRAALERGEAVEIEFALRSIVREARPISVIGSLPARAGAPAGYFLFCAHGDSDSGGPGANDNASGEAIVLEIARVWSQAVANGALPAPPREVRFAIWGSEIASTKHFLAHHADDGGPLLGVLNYDQAGFGSGAEQLNVEPDDVPANAGLVRALVAVLSENAGRPGFPARFATNKSLGGTDSYVFSKSEAFREHARPALTLFTSAWNTPAEHPRTPGMPGESWSARDLVSVDYDNFYHSAGDLPENTTDREPWNMGWCARTGLLGALRWLDELDRR